MSTAPEVENKQVDGLDLKKPAALTLLLDKRNESQPMASPVEASSAAIADGASTAFTLMTVREIEQALEHLPEISRVRILREDGHIHDLKPRATATL